MVRAAAVAASFAAGVLSAPTFAQPAGDWEQAGTRAIDPARGNEILFLFGDDRHREIRLCAVNADLSVLNVAISYASGESQEIATRFVIARGSCSEALALTARRRSIEQLALTYTPFTASNGTPRIRVDAR